MNKSILQKLTHFIRKFVNYIAGIENSRPDDPLIDLDSFFLSIITPCLLLKVKLLVLDRLLQKSLRSFIASDMPWKYWESSLENKNQKSNLAKLDFDLELVDNNILNRLRICYSENTHELMSIENLLLRIYIWVDGYWESELE